MAAIIVGAGTYGEVYLHYLQQAGWKIVGFLDDNYDTHGQKVSQIAVLGGSERLSDHETLGFSHVFCPIGNNLVRTRINTLARSLGLITPNFFHHSAIVDSDITPDSGVYLFPGAIIMPHSLFGMDVMISMGAKVAHHASLASGVFLSTNAAIGAGIQVGERAYFGMGATAVTGKCRTVGRDTVIGAGSIVLSDVPEGAVFVGAPARGISKA